MNALIIVGDVLALSLAGVVSPIALETPAITQNMTDNNATMMGGNTTESNMTSGSSSFSSK
jgi:hypothetical protein